MSGTTTTPSNPALYTEIATNDGITAWAKDNKCDASGKPVVYSAGNNGWIVPAVNQRTQISFRLVLSMPVRPLSQFPKDLVLVFGKVPSCS